MPPTIIRLTTLIVLTLSLPSLSSSKINFSAHLMNNSKYYYNYRMVSNLLGLYSQLKSMGYHDHEMLLQNNQPTYNFPGNIPAGTQRLEDNEVLGNLLNRKTEIDMNLGDVSLNRHIMFVANRYEQYDAKNKRYILSNLNSIQVGTICYIRILMLAIRFINTNYEF